MKAEQLNKAKIPVVKIDPSLNRLKGKVLFPEKLDKANETLARVGMPAEYKPATK